MQNRDLEVHTRFRDEYATRILAMIDDKIVAEHAAGPLANHSVGLSRVLNFFRSAPMADKYIIVCTKPWCEFRIAVLSEEWAVPPRIEENGVVYATETEARHGVFLRRIEDLIKACANKGAHSL
ncbi:hypothetical protein JQ616_17135 [Bradyrhizobium tropiciagri]|uniref:hypothetical protein n=1 Tax=Bradyrhizobium tropiciagri TaxID=312253 RepID=UPI001BA48A98|nr:hypothetical protein [Bradyrhizobium tropiciagri]MBR0896690.1 hypothetical protein [Bradyrhizobium tropiciagri]